MQVSNYSDLKIASKYGTRYRSRSRSGIPHLLLNGSTLRTWMFLCLFVSAVTASVPAGRLVEDLRLSGSSRLDEGRVEVKVRDQWGTVCDDEWDHQDAKVVCRMLRQSGGLAYSGAYFGQGSGRVILDSVGCSGDEESVNQCMLGLSDPVSPSCGHYEDAGVRCGVGPSSDLPPGSLHPAPVAVLPSECRDGRLASPNVRLVGTGDVRSTGLVQVRDPANGMADFGFVCDDNWNLLNAMVVCRELCFDPTLAQPGWHKPTSMSLPANPRIVLDQVQCSGEESSILNCRHLPWNVHDCSPFELAAVTCTDVTQNNKVPQAVVECRADRMVVIFRKNINPSLRREAIVTGEETPDMCQPLMSEDSSRITVTLLYGQCSQLLQDQQGLNGNLTFVSSLLVPITRTASPRNGMSRITKYKINAQCNVASFYSTSRTLPHVGQPILPASGDTRLAVSMDMYQDDTFRTAVKGQNVVLAPGGWVNLGLTLDTEDERVKLVVTACYAGPDLTNPSLPRQALLLDKCIQEATTSIYTLSNKFWGIRFQPFSFDNFTDVTVDCEAYACKTDVATESCDRSCKAANVKHNTIQGTQRFRQRRSPVMERLFSTRRPSRAFKVHAPPDSKAISVLEEHNPPGRFN